MTFLGLLVFLAFSSASGENGHRSSYYTDGEIHVSLPRKLVKTQHFHILGQTGVF
jgi:hypothetical protein